ncbi:MULTISPECIES: hypothetical protein [Tenacibaculum]|nr:MULTISPECIES: hypothetical protein [unclassified Tenacibaculum]SED61885.1 hypothetical protein SAMN04487765_0518 [Tenacibaculum sp. MAR_2010_89]
MKKSILNLGKVLKKEELKKINGKEGGCGWGFCLNKFGRCSILACSGHMV